MVHNDASGQHRLFSHQAMSLVDKYDGEDDALAWLETVETVAELYYWTDDVCLRVARLCMKGPAQRWVHQRTFRDWEDFQHQFARRFGETRETAVARLSRCYQQYDESPEAFADRFLENAARAGRTEDGALVYQFLGRLRPELRSEAARKQPRSIGEVVDFCNYWLGVINHNVADEPAPEYSTTAGFSANGQTSTATPLTDVQTLANSMQLYYMERRKEQDMEISHLRCALQQQREQPLAATAFTQLYRAKARAIPRTEGGTADLANAADYSDDEDSIIEPIMFNYVQPAVMVHAVSAAGAVAADDSDCGSQDEPLMLKHLPPEQFDRCVDGFEPDSHSSSEEWNIVKHLWPADTAAQSCRIVETTEGGHDKRSEVTDQNTESLKQEQTETSPFPVPIGAMAVPWLAPEESLPVDHASSGQSPLGTVKPHHGTPDTTTVAEETTQVKEPTWVLARRTLSPGTKYNCHTPMTEDGKGDYLLRLVPDIQLHNGRLLNNLKCWQPPTAVPSVPPLPWPPPCLMDFGQWLVLLCGPT